MIEEYIEKNSLQRQTKRNLCILLLVFCLTLTSLLALGCAATGSEPGVMRVILEVSEPPRLHETAYFTATAVSVNDEADAEIVFDLPRGAVIVEGEEKWQGSMQANIPVQHFVAIKFTCEGQNRILVNANSWFDRATNQGHGWNDGISLFITPEEGRFWNPGQEPIPVIESIPSGTTIAPVPEGGCLSVPATMEPSPTLALGNQPPPSPEEPHSPLQVELQVSALPRLHEAAVFTITAVSEQDEADADVFFDLPLGAVIVDGEQKWQGMMQANIPIQLIASIKFTRAGHNRLMANASSFSNRNASGGHGDLDVLALVITPEEGRYWVPGEGPWEIIHTSPDGIVTTHTFESLDLPPVVSALPQVDITALDEVHVPLDVESETVIIKGKWLFTEAGTIKGCPLCLVTLTGENSGDIPEGIRAYTNRQGEYAFTVNENDVDGKGVKTIMQTYWERGAGDLVAVKREDIFPALSGNAYAFQTDVIEINVDDCQSGICDFGTATIPQESDNVRAVWVYSDLIAGIDTINPPGSYIVEWPWDGTSYYSLVDGHMHLRTDWTFDN